MQDTMIPLVMRMSSDCYKYTNETTNYKRDFDPKNDNEKKISTFHHFVKMMFKTLI